MRRAVGDDFTLIIRISQWKIGHYNVKMAATPADLDAWLAPIADAGADIFDCSQRRFGDAEFEGSDLNLAGWVKKLTGKPTITVGSIGLNRDFMSDFDQAGQSAPDPTSFAELERRYARGDFDLVAVGRALLGDPQWLAKVRSGQLDALTAYSTEAMQTLR